MKRPLLTILTVLSLTCALLAQAAPRNGQAYQTFRYDLTGDGRPDTISLVAYDVTDSGWNGQLVVKDASGAVLWKGPRGKDSYKNPLVFGSWDWGVAGIEAVGDLQGNGRCEIFAPMPQSDVRPVSYRLLQWTGRGFGFRYIAALMRAGSDRFTWTRKPPESGTGTWVDHFEKVLPDGTCQVHVLKYDGGSGTSEGTAILRADAGGFRVVRWLKPMRRASW